MMKMRIFDVEFLFDEWNYLGVSGVEKYFDTIFIVVGCFKVFHEGRIN